MARTVKKSAARVADGPRAQGFARSLRETLKMLGRPLAPLSVLVLLYAGISYLLWRPLNGETRSYESSAQARLSDAAVRGAFLNQPRPSAISAQDFKQLAQEGVAAAANHSVFEAGLSRKIAQTCERNAWVERVREVRLRFPARVELELEFRKPYARTERGTVLDRRGFALNVSADIPGVRGLPIVAGLLVQEPAIGSRCLDKTVLDALDLLSIVRGALAQSPGALRVSNLERKSGRWRIATDHGPVVLWGEFTDDPPLDEPRTAEKSALLRRKLSEAKDPSILESVNVYDARGPVKRREPAAANMVSQSQH